MSYSKLTNKYLPTPQHSGRRTNKVEGITVHCMAGNLSIESCSACFQPPREASSNYGIGSDGRIGCYVDEENRAWTSSSAWNDNRRITIEVANTSASEPWPISDKAYASLVALCADICKRYNIVPAYDGTINASFTEHRMFAATACPGTVIHEHLTSGKLIKDIKNKMTGQEASDMAITAKDLERVALSVWGYKNKKLEKGDAYQILRDIRNDVADIKKRVTAIEAKIQ